MLQLPARLRPAPAGDREDRRGMDGLGAGMDIVEAAYPGKPDPFLLLEMLQPQVGRGRVGPGKLLVVQHDAGAHEHELPAKERTGSLFGC